MVTPEALHEAGAVVGRSRVCAVVVREFGFQLRDLGRLVAAYLAGHASSARQGVRALHYGGQFSGLAPPRLSVSASLASVVMANQAGPSR